MAFNQWPDDIVASVMLDGNSFISDINPTIQDTQLSRFGMQLFRHGSLSDVKMSVKAFTTGDVEIAQSEKIDISKLDTDQDFYGWVFFEFKPRINMPVATPKRFRFILDNYTFSESGWIAMIHDWPVTMGYNSTPGQIQDAPIAIDLIGAN